MPGTWFQKLDLVHVYLLGIAVQCLHLLEEYLTGFHRLYPQVFGWEPWSDRFFLVLNLGFLAVFVLAALGLLLRVTAARIVVWFFALAMVANGIVHPLLSLSRGSYFPGTGTAPLHLLVGIVLLAKLTGVSSDRKPG